MVSIGGGETFDNKTWYLNRIKRIYVPYELFVITLLIIHLIKRIPLNLNWVWLALGLQGSVVGVLGAEQTWFITPLLLCYLITPLLNKIVTERSSKLKIWLIVLVAIGIKVVWLIPVSQAFDTILSLISYYVIAFVVGRFFESIPKKKSMIYVAVAIMGGSFGLRIVGRYGFDGTVLYDRAIVGYTQTLAAFCIFYIFAVVFGNVHPATIVSKLDILSFEVYLFHYMFCVGPISMFSLTPYWIVNCFIATSVSLITAILLHEGSRRILVYM